MITVSVRVYFVGDCCAVCTLHIKGRIILILIISAIFYMHRSIISFRKIRSPFEYGLISTVAESLHTQIADYPSKKLVMIFDLEKRHHKNSGLVDVEENDRQTEPISTFPRHTTSPEDMHIVDMHWWNSLPQPQS